MPTAHVHGGVSGAGLPKADNSGELLVSSIDNKFHILERPATDGLVLKSDISMPQRMKWTPEAGADKFTVIYSKDYTTLASAPLADGMQNIDGIQYKIWQDSSVPRGAISIANGQGIRIESRGGLYIPGSTYNAPYVTLSLSRQQGLGAVTPEADYSTTENYCYEIMVKWRWKNFPTGALSSTRPLFNVALFNNNNVDPYYSTGGDNQVTDIIQGVLLNDGVQLNGAYYTNTNAGPSAQDLKSVSAQANDVSYVAAFMIRDRTIRAYTGVFGTDWPLIKNMVYRGNGWHSDAYFRQHFLALILNGASFAAIGNAANPVVAIEAIRIRSALL